MANNTDVSTRRRVKLYMLNEERQWDDKGTGHVSATLIENTSMALVVISETDGSHLLESKIQHDTAYQKQQETLIVWSEGDNVDLALSFQEKIGCDDIWEKICNVQGKDPSVDITQDLIDETDDGEDMEDSTTSNGANQGIEFPLCDLGHLSEISEMFSQVINYPIQRERVGNALERSQYIKQLIDLFHKAEDLKDLKSLNHLYEITRAIIQFNRRGLFEMIFSDDYLVDIVGMLEYNPNKRVKHREFLLKKSNFKEIIPICAPLKAKIHQTYRVQYIQDNCLPPPSLFDDNASSTLNQFIYMNKIEIITKLQEDTQFLQQIFGKLLLPDISNETRTDLLGLLKEFCTIVNSLQLQQKESFFTTLSQNRALKALFYSFKIVNDRIQSLCVDILQIFVENQPSVVRDFFLNDAQENSENLYINLLIDHLISDLDPELSTGFLIMNMLKVLVEPENMISNNQRSERQEFLTFFYKYCMPHLIQPLKDLTVGDELKYDDYHTAMVMHEILELLAFCVESHTYHMKNYILNSNVLMYIITLFKSKHKFVILAALRVIRKFVAIRDEFHHRYVTKNHILDRVIDLLDENPQYNMLNSAILELFEYIRGEKISMVLGTLERESWKKLEKHEYTPIFKNIKQSYDPMVKVNKSSTASTTNTSPPTVLSNINPVLPARGSRRQLDEEDEWYDQDDDDIESPYTDEPMYPQSPFVERISKNPVNSSDDSNTDSLVDSSENSVNHLKLNNSRYNRDQISINIKSTTLTLGSSNNGVSSTSNKNVIVSNLENGFNGSEFIEQKPEITSESNNSSMTDSLMEKIVLPIQNGSVTEPKSDNHVSTSEPKESRDSIPTVLTGLVDYDDDEDEEDESVNVKTPILSSSTPTSINQPNIESNKSEEPSITSTESNTSTDSDSSLISHETTTTISNDQSEYTPSTKRLKAE